MYVVIHLAYSCEQIDSNLINIDEQDQLLTTRRVWRRMPLTTVMPRAKLLLQDSRLRGQSYLARYAHFRVSFHMSHLSWWQNDPPWTR